MTAMAPAVTARGAAIGRLTAQGLTARRLIATIRWSDWVVLAFLLYAQALACVRPGIQAKVALWNSAIVLSYAFLLYADSLKLTTASRIGARADRWLLVARDWFPLAVVLFAYREMGWFAQPHAGAVLESRWIVWDRLLLRGGGKAAVEVFGPVLPSILEISYSLVYTLAPFSIAVLYLTGRRDRIDRFLFVFVLGVLLCYAQFPFWPSEPPRVVFFGQDSPSYDTIFRRFNLWMLGNYGIHTSVFPSAHVAGAFAAAFGMRQAAPSAKGVTRFLFVIAILIALATFYGRYHYATDVAAGFLIAAGVSVLARAAEARPHTRTISDSPRRLLPWRTVFGDD
jgi:membrane-associated phospholipid phosphatase